MSTQLRSDLKSTPPTNRSRNAMNPFGGKDFTALAATLSPVGRAEREALLATAPYRQSEFREDLAEYVCAAPLATDDVNAAIAAGRFNAPASALKAAGLRSRTAKRPHTSEGSQDDLASGEGLTVALRGARDRSETASRARRPLLAGAQRDLREPLTAMLRLNSDWNVRGTDMVAVRMIEQQRQALEVMADLIDSFLTIAEPELARAPALLTELASRSVGRKLREASATLEPCAGEWSAEWSLLSAVDRPGVPVAVGPASRTRRVLLLDEDRGVLGALRIYLLCAGYRVFAAATADEALDRARTATSLIDIIVANLDLTGEDDGLAVIDKTRLLLGYNVPAVLLTTQTSIEIGMPALVADVFLLRSPVNLDELNELIGEVLKRPRRSRLAHLRTTGAKLGHDRPNPEVIC
jgi:CheY-like chemotaxis protein